MTESAPLAVVTGASSGIGAAFAPAATTTAMLRLNLGVGVDLAMAVLPRAVTRRAMERAFRLR